MRNLGRCGRRRRQRNKGKDGINLSHLADFMSLCKWMKQTAEWPDLKLMQTLDPAEFFDTGRGMKCRRKIKPGDKVISMPVSLLITTGTVMESGLGVLVLRSGMKFSPQKLLTMFLVMERLKGTKSDWHQYLDCLPASYTTPVYFSTSELALLSPRAKEMAMEARDRFENACVVIREFLNQQAPLLSGSFSTDSLRWAWCSVNTRSVYFKTLPRPGVRIRIEESNMALAPFLDLLNHCDTATVTAGLSDDGKTYDVTTHDSYKKHSQVFINYGPHDNVKLVVDYGFTLPSNQNNSYVFKADAVCEHCQSHHNTSSRELLRRKKELLHEQGLARQLVCTKDGVSWALMTAVKILVLKWDDLSKWKLLLQSERLSEGYEREAHAVTSSLLRQALAESQRHLKTVEESPPSPHRALLLSLAADDVRILDISLSLWRKNL